MAEGFITRRGRSGVSFEELASVGVSKTISRSGADRTEEITISGNVKSAIFTIAFNGNIGFFIYENGELFPGSVASGWLFTMDSAAATAAGEKYVLVTHTASTFTVKLKNRASGYNLVAAYIYELA